MAVRLPVIVSQTAGGSNEQQGREADSVIRLMGLPGIDVSLIGPLGVGTLSSTDQLVLESQERDFAIVASQPTADTMTALRSLGLTGRRAAHRHDPTGEPGQGRRVFCLSWPDFASSEALCQALQQILKDQQTVAVPIALSAAPPPRNPHSSSRAEGRPNAQPSAPPSDRPTAPPPRAPAAAASTPASNADLDDLVENLNDLNL